MAISFIFNYARDTLSAHRAIAINDFVTQQSETINLLHPNTEKKRDSKTQNKNKK